MKKTMHLALFLAVVCGVCGLALAGVNSITAPVIAANNAVTLTDGTYSGKAKGFGGDVVADFTISGGAITEITITGEGETPSIGGAAIPTLQEAILTNGSIDGVDTVGGATITSNAVFDAIRNGLGGN